MIYRGPGYFSFVWFGSSLTPFPIFPLSKLSLFLSLPVCCRSGLLTGEGVEGVEEEPNHTTEWKPRPLKIIQYSLENRIHKYWTHPHFWSYTYFQGLFFLVQLVLRVLLCRSSDWYSTSSHWCLSHKSVFFFSTLFQSCIYTVVLRVFTILTDTSREIQCTANPVWFINSRKSFSIESIPICNFMFLNRIMNF